MTVLACTSSTLPCPAGSRVNTGVLSGTLTTTPVTPAIAKTPASFTLGSAGDTATVVLQGTVPSGSYLLGTSGLSTVPLSGTKCWNTASNSQSCTLTLANTPCVSGYECLETGLSYNNLTSTPAARNPLYTKLAGTNFKFDVVALQSSGAVAAVASQAITFVAGDGGRKTLSTNFNVSNAYPKLRCRVKDTNLTPTVYGCSSDQFAVRPTSFGVTSSANADSTGTDATTPSPIKTGASFTMSAASGVVGYNGTPKRPESQREIFHILKLGISDIPSAACMTTPLR